jgi:hypothetical protein
MSAAEIPVSVFDVPVAPELPPSTPEQQFAAHVAEVRAEGDLIDNRRIFWAKPMAIGSLAATLPAALEYINYGPAGVIMPVVFAGLGMAGLSLRRENNDNRDKAAAAPKLHPEAQEANDMLYELFAVGPKDKREVAMHWFGPADPSKVHVGVNALRTAAQLAQENGVEHFMVEESLARQVFKPEMPVAKTKLDEWLKAHKKGKITGLRAQRENRIGSPKQWLDVAADDALLCKAPFTYRIGGNVLAAGHGGLIAVAEDNGAKPPAQDGVLHLGKEKDTPREITVAKPDIIFVNKTTGLQEELGVGRHNKLFKEAKMHTKVRKTAAFIAGVAVSAMVVFGSNVVDVQYEHLLGDAKAQLAQEHHVSPDDANVTDRALRKRVDGWSSWNTVWDGWRHVRSWPKELWDATKGLRGDSDSADLGLSAVSEDVGNVENGTDQTPIWHLTPNNMNTAGFWAQATSNDVGVYNNKGTHVGLSWNMATMLRDHGESLIATFPATLEDTSGSWIRVDRTIGPTDYLNLNPDTYIPIPMLDGTVPVAVGWNGAPVRVWQGENGAWAVMPNTTEPKGGHVTYWLRKDPKAKVVALGDTTFAAVDNTDVNVYTPTNIFGKYVPGYSDASDRDQATEILRQYIVEHFSYSFKPLPPSAFDNPKTLEDIAQVILDAHKANCNVANTEVALQDPRLNGVFGFENDSSETLNALNRSEAHMKLVKKDGTYIDATPRGGEPITNGKQKNPGKGGVPIEPILALPVLALGIAGYRKRRTLAKPAVAAVNAVRQRRAEAADAELRGTHRYVLRGASIATQEVVWRGSVRPDLNLARAAATSAQTAADAYRQLITTPDLHSPAAIDGLRRSPNVPPGVLRAARLARRANNRPRRSK